MPEGWEIAALGDITLPKVEQVKPEGPITYIDIGSVDNLAKSINEPKKFSGGEKIPSRARQVVRIGDILVSMTRPNLNAVAEVSTDFDGAICSTGFDVLRPIEVEPSWVFNVVRSKSFVDGMAALVQGALYPAVRPDDIRTFNLPLPPRAEQRRIVAKIEALQERSRKAREALAEVGPLLEQFRQSLLAAAFGGDLTADWRAENPDVEPASELLARIRTERRQKWEQAELAKYEAKGKTPPKNWQDKYKEPEPVDEADLPELPEGWCWVRAEEVCEYITKGTTPPKGRMMEDEGEIRFLKVGNLTFDGTLDFSKENAYIDEETHSSGVWARSRIYPGDVLMNLVGPPLGKVALVPPEVPQSNVNQAIAIFRPIAGLSSVFLTHSLLTPSILERIIRRAKATAGQRNLTLELSRGLPVSLPPSREQAEISNRLKAALESISTLEITCEEAEANLDQLDQSILAKAFRGELVPQDPQDEPAAVLLERIRQQREAAAQNGKPKQKTVKRRGKTKSNGIPRRGPLG